MISSFAKGYLVSNEKSFFDAAEKCISFIEMNLIKDGILYRTFKNNTAKIQAYLEDYAFFINALLDVFEINPQIKYLELAKKLAYHLLEHFWDETHNNFFMTSDIHETLIVRPKNNYDLSLPSGNSVASLVLLKLYHLTQEKKFLDTSLKIMESQATMAATNPFGFGFLLNTISMYLTTPQEIVVLNSKDSDISNFLRKKFLPESILVTIEDENSLKNLLKYPFFAGKKFQKTKTTCYVCKNFTCSLALETIPEIEKQL